MSNTVLALIVAIVGVVGTLTAAVLTQLFAMRAQRDQRREESWRTTLKDRRDSCVALNVEARKFQQTLRSYLFEDRDSKSAELEQAWQALISCYSEARIILPQNVVQPAATAFAWLKRTYEEVKASLPPDEREELRYRVDGEVMDAIRKLREASREALGSDLPLRPPKGLLQLSLLKASRAHLRRAKPAGPGRDPR
jgi:hypothetical protein